LLAVCLISLHSLNHTIRAFHTFMIFYMFLLRPPISPLCPYTTLFRSTLKVGSFVNRDCDLSFLCLRALYLLLKKERASAFFIWLDRKSTRLNSSHVSISYAVFCLTNKKTAK